MMFVLDEFLIHTIRKDSFRAKPEKRSKTTGSAKAENRKRRTADVPSTQELDKLALELGREIRNVPPGVFTDDEHLSEMRFRLRVALETVLVAALFLADLTVPTQTLEAFGFHRIGDGFGSSGWEWCY
jgi:hypothetical protein